MEEDYIHTIFCIVIPVTQKNCKNERKQKCEKNQKKNEKDQSPLVQWGLEMPCIIVASMRATVRGNKVTEEYVTLAKQLYTKPENQRIMGSFLNPVLPENIIAQPLC